MKGRREGKVKGMEEEKIERRKCEEDERERMTTVGARTGSQGTVIRERERKMSGWESEKRKLKDEGKS